MKSRASLNGPRLCFAVFLVVAILTLAGTAAEPARGAPASSGGTPPGRSALSDYLTRPAFKPVVMTPVATAPVATAPAPASPWGHWLARSGAAVATLTNAPAFASGEPNDCEVCKDLPKPRKCCGICGRVNECDLCATGVHPLPGGLKGDGAGGAAGRKGAKAKKVVCQSLDCDLRAQPRPCCGFCNRAYECALCVLRKHDPGGKPPTGRAIFPTWQPAFTPPHNATGSGPFCPPVKCVTDCMFRDVPRDCCGHCMQMYECKRCATGLHLPGDVKWVDNEGYRLVSSGKPNYMRRSETQGLGKAQGSKSSSAKSGDPSGGGVGGGSLMLWEMERQLRGITNSQPSRP